MVNKPPLLKTAEEVRQNFSQRQCDSWLLLAYKQYYKRKWGKIPTKGVIQVKNTNKALNSLSDENYKSLVETLKNKFLK